MTDLGQHSLHRGYSFYLMRARCTLENLTMVSKIMEVGQGLSTSGGNSFIRICIGGMGGGDSD